MAKKLRIWYASYNKRLIGVICMMRTPAYILFLFILFDAVLLAALRGEESIAAESQTQAMVHPGEAATPLLPFLDYYIDISRDMDIEEVSSQKMAGEFKALSLNQLPRTEGICWLRFILAPLPPEARPGAFLLDMGQSFPGVPILFDPERNELSGALEWREKSPSQRNIMLLPEEGSQAITCFIKIDGLPGPWFAPIIRSPQNAASNLSSLARNAAILALGVVMLICLLRGLGEKGQWRIWTALFVAVSLVQAILGMPAVSAKFSMASLAATLSPGIALMLLPHVGRHLMQTPFHSKSIDIQLFLLSLPGAALALIPLIPGWIWLDRWVDVWPLCTLIFVPTAIGAWIMGLGGGRRFLVACIIPPLFTGIGLAGLDFGFPPNILSSAPIWGIALCALIIAATRSPFLPQENSRKRAGKAEKSQESGIAQDDAINLEHPLDDPNLRLLPTQAESSPAELKSPVPDPPDYGQEDPEREKTLEERENAIRAPLDEILREAAALGQCSLPPAVRQYAENIISSANMMAEVISGERRTGPSSIQATKKTHEQDLSFSLQKVLRNVHDSVASFAESSGTALSWYIPPNLGRLYRGDEEELENILYLLLESSVRGSKNGSVRLSARRVPGSDDPGYILFSITDNGTGVPPKDRSSLAISRAWELAGQNGGYLAMEAGPNGVDIALTMHFSVEGEEEQNSRTENHILLASDNTARRRELAEALAQLPCRISQLGTIQEVLVCQSRDPSALLIAHGQMARPSAADTIHKFASLAREAGFSKSFILAITEDDKQWHLLKHSGFTHAMQEPDDLETLRDTISALLQALQDNKTQPGPQDKDQKALKEDDGKADQKNDGQKGVLFTGSASVPDAGGTSHSENFIPSRSPHPPLAAESDSLPQDAELPAFEGPDWLKPVSSETSPQENGRSALFIPQDNKDNVSPGREDHAESGQIKPDEEKGANSTPAMDNLIDAANAQAPYNSIMEYVIGSENRDNGASSRDGNVFADASVSASRPLSAVDNPPDKAEYGAATRAKKGEAGGDPVVQALIHELDDAMLAATNAYNAHDSAAVAEATARIISEAENVGLRLLAKMASCVERAAKENDETALSDLLPELALAVERNRLALDQNRRDSRQG